MRNAKLWLFGAFVTVALMGTAMLTTASFSNAEPPRAAARDHWQHHDGRWSYWHEADRRWYYTDGTNWYYNEGGESPAWRVYNFDKEHKFGSDFERGEYKVPAEGIKIELPRHKIYIGR